MSQERLTPKQLELQARLAELSPATPAGRDRLFYQAGLTKARRRHRAALTTLSLLAAVLAILALWPRSPQVQIVERVVEKPVYVQVATPTPVGDAPIPAAYPMDDQPPPPPLAANSYFRIRELVMQKGLDALPADQTAGPAPTNLRNAWQQFGL